jgi:hypothetical protein
MYSLSPTLSFNAINESFNAINESFNVIKVSLSSQILEKSYI